MATNSSLGTNKRALLVIGNPSRRKVRTNAFRDVGIEVVCAEHIGEARELWHPAVFDLVVIDMKLHNQDAIALCAAIKAEAPKQRIAWFVGSPVYLSATPLSDASLEDDDALAMRKRQAIATACKSLSRRGGFLEACWRMQLERTRLRSLQSAAPVHTAHRSPAPQRTGDEKRSAFGAAIRQAEVEQEGTSRSRRPNMPHRERSLLEQR